MAPRIRCSNSESDWCTCRWEEIDSSLAPCKPTVRDLFFHPPCPLVSKRSGIYDVPVFFPLPWFYLLSRNRESPVPKSIGVVERRIR